MHVFTGHQGSPQGASLSIVRPGDADGHQVGLLSSGNSGPSAHRALGTITLCRTQGWGRSNHSGVPQILTEHPGHAGAVRNEGCAASLDVAEPIPWWETDGKQIKYRVPSASEERREEAPRTAVTVMHTPRWPGHGWSPRGTGCKWTAQVSRPGCPSGRRRLGPRGRLGGFRLERPVLSWWGASTAGRQPRDTRRPAYLTFVPGSGTREPRPLGISGVTSVLVVSERTGGRKPLAGFRMELGSQRSQRGHGRLETLAPLGPPGTREVLTCEFVPGGRRWDQAWTNVPAMGPVLSSPTGAGHPRHPGQKLCARLRARTSRIPPSAPSLVPSRDLW